jgi:hypothetical protein
MKKHLISITLAGLLSCSALQAQLVDDPSIRGAEPEKAQLEQLSQYMNCGDDGDMPTLDGGDMPTLDGGDMPPLNSGTEPMKC